MKNYELTYNIDGLLEESEAKNLKEKISSFILESEGMIIKDLSVFKRVKLGYPIKKSSQAFFFALEFQLAPEKIIEVDKKLKAEKDILRYALFIKKPYKEGKLPRRRPAKTITSKSISSKTTLGAKTSEPKVELKEIDKKLEEILNE